MTDTTPTRREFLTGAGAIATLTFSGVTTPASAETLAQRNRRTIRRLINFYDSTPGSDITVYMFATANTTKPPRGVTRRQLNILRSEAEFAINTLREIRGGSFQRRNQTEQFQRLWCLNRITSAELLARSKNAVNDGRIFHGRYQEHVRLDNELYSTAISSNIPLRQCTAFLQPPKGLTIN